MKQIRRSVFETNSSSVHSISIIKKVDQLTVKKKIHFDKDCEFGWNNETFNDCNSKANYLMSGIAYTAKSKVDLDRNTKLFLDALTDIGCEYNIPKVEHNHYGESEWFSFGGVDHGNELDELVTDVLNDRELLYNFLFSASSVVETGDDNEDHGIPSPWQENDSNYIVYTKGN